ncbi:hypothetical protein D3C81_2170020 [compost metagenome]
MAKAAQHVQPPRQRGDEIGGIGALAHAGRALAARRLAKFQPFVGLGGRMDYPLGIRRKRLHFYSLRFYSLFRITKLNSI